MDLELVLAVDASRSADPLEDLAQRLGYVAAFRHPQVLAAIRSGAYGRIAVAYVDWADAATHYLVVPWTLVEDEATAEAFAARLEAAPIRNLLGTSLSGALAYSWALFGENGFAGERRAIDISGDGRNALGPPVALVRDAVVERGVTINGLPVMLRTGSGSDAELDLYYRDCVIGGPGAFVVRVESTEGFESAIRRKLILEVAGLTPTEPARPVAFRSAPRVACD